MVEILDLPLAVVMQIDNLSISGKTVEQIMQETNQPRKIIERAIKEVKNKGYIKYALSVKDMPIAPVSDPKKEVLETIYEKKDTGVENNIKLLSDNTGDILTVNYPYMKNFPKEGFYLMKREDIGKLARVQDEFLQDLLASTLLAEKRMVCRNNMAYYPVDRDMAEQLIERGIHMKKNRRNNDSLFQKMTKSRNLVDRLDEEGEPVEKLPLDKSSLDEITLLKTGDSLSFIAQYDNKNFKRRGIIIGEVEYEDFFKAFYSLKFGHNYAMVEGDGKIIMSYFGGKLGDRKIKIEITQEDESYFKIVKLNSLLETIKRREVRL